MNKLRWSILKVVAIALMSCLGIFSLTNMTVIAATNSCTTIGATCVDNGTVILSPSTIQNTIYPELIAEAQTYPHLAVKIGDYAAQLGTLAGDPTYWQTLATQGTHAAGIIPDLTPKSNLKAQTALNLAISTFGASSFLTESLINQLVTNGYQVTYTVVKYTPPPQSAGLGGGTTSTSNTCGNILFVIPNLPCDLDTTNVINSLISYILGIATLPFFAAGGMVSWIGMGTAKGIGAVYGIMAGVGILVAAAATMIGVVLDMFQFKLLTLLRRPMKFLVAITLIGTFPLLYPWLTQEATQLGVSLYATIVRGSNLGVFTNSGSVSPQLKADFYNMELVGLLAVIIFLLLMIWLFLLFVIRSVLLAFTIVLAPLALGLLGLDFRNQFFQTWLRIFVGAELMTIAGAIGMGVTFDLFAVLSASGTAIADITAVGTLFGGLIVTTKLMTMVMQGSMQHKSPTTLLMGMGEAAVAGMGIRALAGHAGGGMRQGISQGTSTARTGVASMGRKISQLSTGKPPVNTSVGSGNEILTGLSPAEQATLAPHSSEIESAIASDPQSQYIIRMATKHLPNNADDATRLNYMKTRPTIYATLIQQMVHSGTGLSDMLAGGAMAGGMGYSAAEIHNLENLAARTQFAAQKANEPQAPPPPRRGGGR